MKRFVIVLAIVVTFAWAGTAGAQGFAIGAHAGWSNPLGAYEDDFGADAAGARPGFTLGVDATHPLRMLTDNLSWHSSLSLVRNRTEGSQDRTGGLVSGAFTLLPVMTGLRYDLGTLPSLYISAQGGPLLVRGPTDFYPYSDPSIGFQLGYAAGVGLQLSERLSVSAKYFPLGDLDFEYGGSETLTQEVDFLDIRVGVRLF
jgi:opacity protein-like surface antigen